MACDGAEYQREWFHLECVGLKHEPKGSGKLIQVLISILAIWVREGLTITNSEMVV